MYFNKFSSGTILALLALSAMFVLVPLAAPVHATNSSPLTIAPAPFFTGPLVGDGEFNEMEYTITNPATNSYAVTGVTLTFSLPGFAVSAWDSEECEPETSHTFLTCSNSGTNSVSFFFGGSSEPTYPGILPGTSAVVYVGIVTPDDLSNTVFPLTATITSVVQDASSSAYYTGPSLNQQTISPDSEISFVLTPGGSNTATSFTAGTAPYSLTATVNCTDTADGCPSSGVESGVQIWFAAYNDTAGAYQTNGLSVTSGNSGGSGTLSTTIIPSNHAGQEEEVVSSFGPGTITGTEVSGYNEYWFRSSGWTNTGFWTTIPGTPASVGFSLSDATFPNIDYINTEGTTTNTNTAGTYTGAELNVGTTAVAISVTDRFGNHINYGAGGVTFVGSQAIAVQTASGGLFDTTNLPSSITCGVTAGFTCPVSGNAVNEPFNYYQGPAYGTAGVLTATITGTYGSSTFSVSGSSGTIQTSTFAVSGSFETTAHVALGATNVKAGGSLTVEYVLGVAQANVPVTLAVCPNDDCGATTKGYVGSFSTVSGVTNSSGILSSKFSVDTTAGYVAVLNATVQAPTNANPTGPGSFFVTGPSAAITTIAGAAAKFTVVVGIGSNLDPSPITYSYPGQTVYVNVVTSDAYGNPVATVGAEEVGITLAANPASLSDSNPAIPTGCASTNATAFGTPNSKYTCSSGDGSSFGPIAWTLPSTVGSTATITATGVINGLSVTSATTTISIVSKLPTLSVFSPAPLAGVIYSSSVNVVFRGWANASLGYNGLATMSSLGWKIGTNSWQTTAIGGTNAQWSVVATLPVGLSTITFNATDSKGNVVVGSTYSVLVDNTAPVINNITPANTKLAPGQLFQATIVVAQGDLNATSVGVTYNGTALPASDVSLSGTNKLGSSVTYTVTALLPTGNDTVQVSASSLAGLSASSTSELVDVSVAFADSITFTTGSAVYGTVGAYTGITVPVTNLWSTSQNIVVFATLKGSGGALYVAEGTTTLAPGQTANVFTIDLSVVPAGTYSVTFAAVSTSNLPDSAPTTPITVTVP